MKTVENDKKLKELLREVKLESPGNDFTMKVMNRVWEEKSIQSRVEVVKNERILGKGFWIILVLFVGLLLPWFLLQAMEGRKQVNCPD